MTADRCAPVRDRSAVRVGKPPVTGGVYQSLGRVSNDAVRQKCLNHPLPAPQQRLLLLIRR